MRYFTIEDESMVNGPGLREILWVSGCEHHCKECHNPETWNKEADGSKEFDTAAKKDLFKRLDRDFIDGITISGGDPLAPYNREEVGKLVKSIRKKFGGTKTIWIYTGYKFDEIKDLEFIKLVDVVVDEEFKIDKKDTELLWRGSSNQHLVNVAESLKAGKIIEYKHLGVK